MQCFVGPKWPAAAATATATGEENGDGHQSTRDASSPASAVGSTMASSAAASPVETTISLNHEYTLAVGTNSYNEIWSKIHHRRPSEEGEEEPWTSPNAHLDLVIERVIQPDRQSIQEVLRSARPTQLTRLVSDYLDSSEHTSHLFLSLRDSVERARLLYSPISQLLYLIVTYPVTVTMQHVPRDKLTSTIMYPETVLLQNAPRDTLPPEEPAVESNLSNDDAWQKIPALSNNQTKDHDSRRRSERQKKSNPRYDGYV